MSEFLILCDPCVGPPCRKNPVVLPVTSGCLARQRAWHGRRNVRRGCGFGSVSPTGVEPVTFGSGGRRSIQLSYGDDGLFILDGVDRFATETTSASGLCE